MPVFTPSLPLDSLSRAHVLFLQEVNSAPRLHDDDVIRNAVRRYETCWLPLVAANAGQDLDPPLDVHWLWHCHMLAPQHYASDTLKLVGCTPDHTFILLSLTRQKARQRTEELWNIRYPTEEFNVNLEQPMAKDKLEYTSVLSYDLIAAAGRQRSFYYHVSLPHYLDKQFLETALQRYGKFISLKQAHPDVFIVPMYDVDLIWHTHQLHPKAYQDDTSAFLGYMLNHDDQTTDRSPGSKLTTSDAQTRQLWRQTYGEHFAVSGALYRGEPPHGRLYKMSQTDRLTGIPLMCKLGVDKVTLTGCKDKYKVTGYMEADNNSFNNPRVTLPLRKGGDFVWTKGHGNHLLTADWNSERRMTLQFDFTRRDGIQGALFGKSLCSTRIVTNPYMNHVKVSPDDMSVTMTSDAGVCSVQAECTARRVQAADTKYSVTWGSFNDVTMPEDIDQLWGPVGLPRLPDGVPNTCRVASHTLTHIGSKYTVRVIHSLPLRMSVVQVFYRDKMAAVSQLIGAEQLPTPEQVNTTGSMFLDTKKGERAMLIKNTDGDWAVIKGSWEGLVRGQAPATKYGKGKRGCRGYLSVSLKKLDAMLTTSACKLLDPVTRNSSAKKETFRLDAAYVNLINSTILIEGNCRDVPETIASIFSACVLYALCEPRPDVMTNNGLPDPRVSSRQVKRGARTIDVFDANTYVFIYWIGYHEPMLSNSWLYWHSRTHDHTIHTATDLEGAPCPDQDTFCPWDPDGVTDGEIAANIDGATGDGAESGFGVSDGGAVCGGCGGCAASCGGGGGGYSGGGGGDSGGGGGFSSCGAGGGDSGGGGGSSCGASCGGGGGGSSCGSSCGGGCGGD